MGLFGVSVWTKNVCGDLDELAATKCEAVALEMEPHETTNQGIAPPATGDSNKLWGCMLLKPRANSTSWLAYILGMSPPLKTVVMIWYYYEYDIHIAIIDIHVYIYIYRIMKYDILACNPSWTHWHHLQANSWTSKWNLISLPPNLSPRSNWMSGDLAGSRFDGIVLGYDWLGRVSINHDD